MKDNTITTEDGIEVYKHNINYYADEYIRNELEIDHVDTDSKQIVKDNFPYRLGRTASSGPKV